MEPNDGRFKHHRFRYKDFEFCLGRLRKYSRVDRIILHFTSAVTMLLQQ